MTVAITRRQKPDMTTKEKIDQALGISCGKNMDQMLDELSLDSDEIQKTLDGFDGTLKTELENIDKKALELQQGVGNGMLVISDMTASLKEIERLVDEAKQIFFHIKENIVSTDLIDSELIQGAAKFLEAVHVNIAEFISIYKQKSKFVEKVKLMIFNQQQKIELANLKHKQNLELLEAKKKDAIPAVDGVCEMFDTDKIVKSLSKNWDGDCSGIGFEHEDDDDTLMKEFEKEDREEEAQEKADKTAKTAPITPTAE